MRFWVWVAMAMGFVCTAGAQDIHFSQFHVASMLQNPANAGFFNCSYRFTAVYRNQWNSIGNVPYRTFTGSYDMRFIGRGNSTRGDIMGAGAVFTSDKAGDADLTHSGINVVGSYHKNIDRDHAGINFMGAGLMLGYGGGSVDYMRLRFGDQYIGPGQINPVSAQGPFSSFGYLDISGGVVYNWVAETRTADFQVGAALFHLTEPNKSMMGGDANIARKLVVHGSGHARLNSKLEIFPRAQFTRQGRSSEAAFGSLLRLDLDKMKNDLYGVYFGVFGRVVGNVDRFMASDALIFSTRFDVNQLSLGFSYDVNISELRTATDSRGGPEFSLIYIGCFPQGNPRGVYCPRF